MRGAGFEPAKALSHWLLRPAPLAAEKQMLHALTAREPPHSVKMYASYVNQYITICRVRFKNTIQLDDCVFVHRSL
jgi:hypothetical protein